MSKDEIFRIRRNLLKGMVGIRAIPFIGALAALQTNEALAAGKSTSLVISPYGPVSPALDETTGLPLLQLPKGFTYSSFGWQGDLMSNGKPCPGRHDGMGVIASQNNTKDADIVLVRNHEVGFSEPGNFIEADGIYDRDTRTAADQSLSGGGTTSLLFRNGKWISMVPSLGGTQLNCAGGVTPWGTWLTCEEIGFDLTSSSGKKHGYVFEVHADPGKTSGQPIIAMGRFAHEAAAVDPHTGIVYMTEDSAGKSGFYRYIPNVAKGSYGSLAKGGVLQMAKVKDIHNANLAAVPVDAIYPLEWITISEPDRNRGDAIGPSGIRIVNASGPFVQGWKEGAARMNRGEGIWYFQGKLYVMDTSGGFASRGSIWELDLKRQTIKSIYSSPHALVGNMGDNLTVSPGGGLLLCEDANEKTIDSFGMGQRLMGLTAEGSAYIFAKNNVSLNPDDVKKAGKTANALGDHRNQEFCGACFDPAGHFLFVNIQTPGITFAITGPWGNGPLRS